MDQATAGRRKSGSAARSRPGVAFRCRRTDPAVTVLFMVQGADAPREAWPARRSRGLALPASSRSGHGQSGEGATPDGGHPVTVSQAGAPGPARHWRGVPGEGERQLSSMSRCAGNGEVVSALVAPCRPCCPAACGVGTFGGFRNSASAPQLSKRVLAFATPGLGIAWRIPQDASLDINDRCLLCCRCRFDAQGNESRHATR